MRIAIDIDGTLNDYFSWVMKNFIRYAKKNGVKVNLDLKEYEMFNMFGITKEDFDKFWNEYIWCYAKTCKPQRGAAKYVSRLYDQGHEIVILSARAMANSDCENGKKMRQIVKEWFDKNKIKYSQMCFVPQFGSKFATFKEQQCDLLVDDRPAHLYEISAFKPCICFEQTYNRYQSYPGNVYKCRSWRDVYKTVQKLAEENNANN